MRYISVEEYLMGRASLADLSFEQASNMHGLIQTVNRLLEAFGEFRKVNSGYRREADNKAVGGSPKSKHLTCQAIDLEDKNGKLKAFCTPDILADFGLYMEHPDATPSWCHLQDIAPKSGNRVFRP